MKGIERTQKAILFLGCVKVLRKEFSEKVLRKRNIRRDLNRTADMSLEIDMLSPYAESEADFAFRVI